MEDKYEAIRLKNQLCFPIYLCSKEIIKRYEPFLNEVNLTYTQYIVMMYFWEKKMSNVKDLGNVLLLDSSTLTPLLKKLESKGYLKRERSDKDERNLIVSLTKLGEELQNRVIEIPKKIGKCLDLDEKDAQTLYHLIYKVLVNVVKEEENGNN